MSKVKSKKRPVPKATAPKATAPKVDPISKDETADKAEPTPEYHPKAVDNPSYKSKKKAGICLALGSGAIFVIVMYALMSGKAEAHSGEHLIMIHADDTIEFVHVQDDVTEVVYDVVVEVVPEVIPDVVITEVSPGNPAGEAAVVTSVVTAEVSTEVTTEVTAEVTAEDDGFVSWLKGKYEEFIAEDEVVTPKVVETEAGEADVSELDVSEVTEPVVIGTEAENNEVSDALAGDAVVVMVRLDY